MQKLYSLEGYKQYISQFFSDEVISGGGHEMSFNAERCGDTKTLAMLYTAQNLVLYKVTPIFYGCCSCIDDDLIEEAIYYYTYMTLEVGNAGGYDDLTRERHLDIFLMNAHAMRF